MVCLHPLGKLRKDKIEKKKKSKSIFVLRGMFSTRRKGRKVELSDGIFFHFDEINYLIQIEEENGFIDS